MESREGRACVNSECRRISYSLGLLQPQCIRVKVWNHVNHHRNAHVYLRLNTLFCLQMKQDQPSTPRCEEGYIPNTSSEKPLAIATTPWYHLTPTTKITAQARYRTFCLSDSVSFNTSAGGIPLCCSVDDVASCLRPAASTSRRFE